MQVQPTRVPRQRTRDRNVARAHRNRGRHGIVQSHSGHPAGQVVRHDVEGEPRAVGGKATGGQVIQGHAVLEVADGVLHHRVAAVVRFQHEHGARAIGDQGVTASGLPAPEKQHEVDLGAWGMTTPDFFWQLADDDEPGICVYVDGLSEGIHGNPARARRDNQLRDALDAKGYRVLALAASQLDDRDAIRAHLRRLARALGEREAAEALRFRDDWWREPAAPSAPAARAARAPAAPVAAAPDELQYLGGAARHLVEQVCRAGAPRPQVGYELYGDGAAGWPLEAAWPDERVAVVLDAVADRDAWLEAQNWKSRHADRWTPDELRTALLQLEA